MASHKQPIKQPENRRRPITRLRYGSHLKTILFLLLQNIFQTCVIVFVPSHFHQQKISHETRSGDLVGHMIILLQYDWPKEDQTFFELLDRIRSHGGLTYRKFFNYIVSILVSIVELFKKNQFNLMFSNSLLDQRHPFLIWFD